MMLLMNYLKLFHLISHQNPNYMSTNSALIQGTIINLGEIEQKSEKFKMRNAVVKTEDKYPQEIAVQFTNANVDKSSPLKIGDAVTIHCNIRGREYNGKWYNSLDAWRVDLNGNQKPIESTTQAPAHAPAPTQNTANANVVDDLPF